MQEKVKIISENRKARHDYFLENSIECGIVLQGTEIKAMRCHSVNISDSYVIIRNGEAFILNMDIAPYEKGNIFNHDPKRTRKLLLHKKEILKLKSKIDTKGYTLIPTKVYLSAGKAKIEVALAKGKKDYDKRETDKQRDIKREMEKPLYKDDGME